MQRQKRNSGLKRLLGIARGDDDAEGSQADALGASSAPRPELCSVVVLQVWPSQGSPRGEADGQSFTFPSEHRDSGIDSIQASPSPLPAPSYAKLSPSDVRRTFLHPQHARIMSRSGECDRLSVEDANPGFATSRSTSAGSSTTSIAAVTASVSGASDPLHERRRSSTLTARYSLLDALDLEYALARAAARGSVDPCHLSQSLQKLTFTQSLAFPALARGLADRRSKTEKSPRIESLESGLNAFAKVAAVLLLVLASVLVFGVVYKFART